MLCLADVVVELEHMCFSFVISHRHELALVAELHRHWVLENTRSCAREILEDRVGWDVSNLECILLPLRAHGEHLTRVVKAEIGDRRREVR